MIFTQGKGTEATSLSKVQKDIKELQTQVEDNAQEITNVDEDLQSYKNIVALQQSEQNTTINTVNDKVTNLQSYTEDYVEQNQELIETQVLRTSEYVETPLLRAINVQIGETELSDVISDVTTLKEDVSTLKDDVETLKGKADTDEEEIEKLKDRTSILEQKVDTILEQGEIPITTDEVQLGNALISENGNVYYGNIELAQSDTYKPVAGALIQPTNKTFMVLKSNSVGYLLGDCQVEDEGDTVQDFWDNYDLYFSEFTSPRARMTYGDIALLNNDISSEGDAIKSINSGMIKEIIYFSESDLDSFTYNTQLSYFFIATKEHKLYKFENGILTDVTDTKTVFSQSEITISYGISCEYKNYAMTRHLSYEGTQFIHNSTTENGIEKWTYWELGN